ncbi:MAG: Rpn family recombination-promoting nuclease/putative transposase [Bacteroidia bacterium]
MAKYINPYTDFGFKKLFGEEGNKNLLKDFLNQLLPEHHQIEDLTFQNVEQVPDTSEERKAFFDVHCKSTSGERFIVEMQKAKVDFFKDRSLYYLTYPIREQAQRGEWNFELSAIYFIAVLDFWYEAEKTAKFHRYIVLKDQDNDPFYDKLGLVYLQMPAFTKTESELKTHFDKWAYFLKNLEKFDDIPQILNESVFAQAFNTAEVANLSKQQREDYEKSRLSYIGVKQVTETAEKDGVKKGKMEIAKKMKDKSMQLADISDLTGLTTEEIEKL